MSHISAWDSRNISWGGGNHPGLQRLWVITSLVTWVHPLDHREKIPLGANGQLDPEGDSSFWGVRVKASDTQRIPVRCRNQPGSAAHHTGKNPGSNSGLLQEAERETDHLLETASNHLLWWSRVSQVQTGGQKYCAMQKCVRYLQELMGVWVFPGK
jgi:hypothetical protein